MPKRGGEGREQSCNHGWLGGIVHPCKVYNILTIGAPLLYIGPRQSHVAEVLSALDGQYFSASAAHGDVAQVVQHIKRARQHSKIDQKIPAEPLAAFSKETVLPKLIDILEAP